MKKLMLGLIAIFNLFPMVSYANHDCEIAPWDGDRRKRVMVPAGETVTLWKGINWKGKVFVTSATADGATLAKLWIDYPGGERKEIPVGTLTPPSSAIEINAPSNGAVLRAVFDKDTLCMVCVLKDVNETVESIKERLAAVAEKCRADQKCWDDVGIEKDLPHSSVILPDHQGQHDHM